MNLAIIGAGTSGLVALKEARESSFFNSIIVFERNSSAGGQWSSLPSSVKYLGLRLNSSFSHPPTPFLRYGSEYIPFSEYESYVADYIDKHYLSKSIKFHSKVIQVKPVVNSLGLGNGNLGWDITWKTGKKVTTQRFDQVICCSGAFSIPRPLLLTGFTGNIVKINDTSKLSVPEKLLIVGAGSTALDLAEHFSRLGTRVTLSVRSRTFVLPRLIDGEPLDQVAPVNIRFKRLFPFNLFYGLRFLNSISLLEYSLDGAHCTISNTLKMTGTFALNSYAIEKIKDGGICIAPSTTHALGNTVFFSNGISDEFDCLIEATGYERKFPYLDEDVFSKSTSTDSWGLYRKIYPTNRVNIAFIAFTRVVGSVVAASEIQVRHALSVFQGHVKLPALEEMAECPDLQTKDSIFPIPYFDTLMRDLGALPPLWSSWIWDWKLAFVLWFRPAHILQWRINGIGAYPDAAERLKKIWGF